MTQDDQQKAKQGVILAVAAYTMWGVAPIYFKALGDVSPLEILSHRVFWSFFLLAILLHVGRRWRSVRDVFKTPKKPLLLACTAVIVAANWLIFIWAVNADHMLDASLGYYINPLLNVLLGMLFLGERLRKLQWVAVFLASCGVLVQLLVFGSIPIVAIALALTFGFYGLVRKKINLEAVAGLFIETLVLLPVAAIYLGFIADTPTSQLSHNSWSLNLLLVSAGIVTTLPLLCFTGAATRLQFSTLGFFQYIGPSLMFILAVSIYQEPFTSDKAITFAFIWLALVLFSFDGLRNTKRRSS